jgi:lipoprotein NlpI
MFLAMVDQRRPILLLLAGSALAMGAGCTTVPAPPAPTSRPAAEAMALKQTETVLGMVRQVGWKEVEDLLPVLEEQPPGDFPGVAAFAADLRTVAAATRTIPGASPIDSGRLIDHNPHFWTAFYEIAPGDPLMARLHVSLLLAAGEIARADYIATLAINFGRMALDHRQELVRLDVHAQLALQGSRRSAQERQRLRSTQAFAALAEEARAALAVWPQDPAALADLATAQRGLGGPGIAAVDSPIGRSLAALHEAAPLMEVGPAVAGPKPASARDIRALWTLIDEEKATGDDEVLARFSTAAQAAGVDDLALVARSLLAGWSAGSVPLDENFARASLQRLVDPEAAAGICAEAFAEGHQWIGLNTEEGTPPADLKGVSVHPQLEQRLLVQIAETSYWIGSGLVQGADLAGNYGERGGAWALLLQKDDAVTDFRHSLQLDPGNNAVRYSLAVTLSDAGDFKEADAVFAEAAKRAPRGAGETQAWGNHLFKQGRFAAAEEAYSRAARFDPAFAYARIMRHLARLRQGKPGGARLDLRVEKVDVWGAALLDFLAGRLDEKALFGRLEGTGGLRYSEEECELYFVRAELALSRGDIAEARRNLHSCLGTGISSFVEYALARQELRRLDASHPPPKEKNSSGGDTDDQPA